MTYIEEMFSAQGKIVLFTGGAGILASALAKGLGNAGATIILTDIVPLEESEESLRKDGISVRNYMMNVMEKENVQETVQRVIQEFGRIDVLMNAAGGNRKEATTSDEISFFDLSMEPLEKVVLLNLFGGAVIPSQVIARRMVEQPEGGCIINFSSMAAFRPLTRILGYAAAKAAVSNFTQWLAVHLAQSHSPKVRVNALAPGFFSTKQNKYLLYSEEGSLTARGKAIISHTPAGRFGIPEDLISTVLWLISPASGFVTGVVVPVDGGFSAFSGV
ncbi:MAG: SDR family oxidoreductase [Candidatus Atribacteria bacterium]|nr:SDR family oxidoreductase [Candidatus Atribacteria bacterium]